MDKKHLIIATDGGSRGNPGPAAIGILIEENDKEVFRHGKCIGETTNNVAEYTAVLEAIKWVKENHPGSKCDFYLDSELIAKQMSGEYKVKEPRLKEIFYKIRELVIELSGEVSFTHVYRHENKIADKLVNDALDKKC